MYHTNFVCGLALLCMCISQVCPEMFTALVDLERVLRAEDNLARDLRSYIAKEENRLKMLKSIANDYEAHSREALSQDAEAFLGNPLNAFLLVKRFTTDWDKVENLIRNNTSETFLSSISGTLSNFPDDEDLSGAASALLRLQDTYALPTNRLANGEIQGVKKSPVLTAEDCFEMGRYSYNQKDYYHTVMWMSEALDRLEDYPSNQIGRALVLDYLSFSSSMQGNIKYALDLTNDLLALEPDHTRAQNNKRYYEQLLAEQEQDKKKGDDDEVPIEQIKNERNLDDYRSSSEFAGYEALCRGEEVYINPYKHKLTCRYLRHHPFFFYGPLKEEQVYKNPGIWIYHKLMTHGEVDRIKELAAPRLKRATVQNPLTGKLETAYYRVSKSAWLRDIEDPVIARVSQKTAAMANLTLETVEELQVVNYGIGGHYEPHYDFARKDEKAAFDPKAGNRIATAIYYMSDVEAGGATVFTQLGVQLWPEKGSVALWYNLLKSGEGDYRTRHAACPVLSGSKWVANKWFHERGQDFSRPCSQNPNE